MILSLGPVAPTSLGNWTVFLQTSRVLVMVVCVEDEVTLNRAAIGRCDHPRGKYQWSELSTGYSDTCSLPPVGSNLLCQG